MGDGYPMCGRVHVSGTETTYKLNEDVFVASVGDEAVVLVPSSGLYYGLNPVAARVWHLLQTPASADQLTDALLKRFEVNRRTLEADIAVLLARLEQLNLVSRVRSS